MGAPLLLLLLLVNPLEDVVLLEGRERSSEGAITAGLATLLHQGQQCAAYEGQVLCQ